MKNLKAVAVAFVLIVGASYAKAWTGPTMSPPNGNISAPLNISSSTQSKLGSLVLNSSSPIQNAIGLTVFGTTSLNGGLQVNNGSAVAGQVLTALDSSGNAGWANAASGGSTVTSGNDSHGAYWFQIGSDLLIEGGTVMSTSTLLNNSSITYTQNFPKAFSTVVSVQFTPLNNPDWSQVHPEQQVMLEHITTTGFVPRTINNNGFTWLAIGKP